MSSSNVHIFHGWIIGVLPIGFFALACFLILQQVYWMAILLLVVCVVFWLILAGDKIKRDGRVN
ncbi:hypothetical protein HX109_15515 [Galbibacter sp. BG1]|uniref:hypothetical protein n=1 Tax=Galbibacter sp. BG1 TaxID=1170699 RepID=UPI0015BA016B|nr:hypothetical protein [Galbibacter sp. BG1]QLE02908.1 hypothetical protein HX109_15515 [Galbibacter sp. BG1]